MLPGASFCCPPVWTLWLESCPPGNPALSVSRSRSSGLCAGHPPLPPPPCLSPLLLQAPRALLTSQSPALATLPSPRGSLFQPLSLPLPGCPRLHCPEPDTCTLETLCGFLGVNPLSRWAPGRGRGAEEAFHGSERSKSMVCGETQTHACIHTCAHTRAHTDVTHMHTCIHTLTYSHTCTQT